jgi:hypothetical protein
MATLGGRRRVPGTALLLILAGVGMVISGCEYAEDDPVLAASPPGPSRATPPPPPIADPGLAEVQARNQAQLEVLLGPRPGNVVFGTSGSIGGSGFRGSSAGIPQGTYTVTAACIGVSSASLSITQPDRRGGKERTLPIKCGTKTSTTLDLGAGPVSVHGIRMSTGTGAAAVAGFWLVPAP